MSEKGIKDEDACFCIFKVVRVGWYINCSNSNPMKVSQIKTQHTLLTLNNKKDS
jgi:hypothetical protein